MKKLSRIVLGDGGTDGTTAYSETERELFAWYSYLFVSGSKPVAHARMLAELDDDILRDQCPDELEELINRVKSLVGHSES